MLSSNVPNVFALSQMTVIKTIFSGDHLGKYLAMFTWGEYVTVEQHITCYNIYNQNPPLFFP